MTLTAGQALVQMLDRMMVPDLTGPANAVGEVKGIGPPWVCANYAAPGHDYGTCSDCYSNYETNYLPSLKGDTA